MVADFLLKKAPKPGSSVHQGNCQLKMITIEELSLMCASASGRFIQSKRPQERGGWRSQSHLTEPFTPLPRDTQQQRVHLFP